MFLNAGVKIDLHAMQVHKGHNPSMLESLTYDQDQLNGGHSGFETKLLKSDKQSTKIWL